MLWLVYVRGVMCKVEIYFNLIPNNKYSVAIACEAWDRLIRIDGKVGGTGAIKSQAKAMQQCKEANLNYSTSTC